jgi:hypothetical protein
MKTRGYATILLLIICGVLAAYETRDLVDIPTAGILQRGEYSVFAKIYRDCGVLSGAQVGLFPRFMFGVTYGGENIVGNQQATWHELPGVSVKVRFLDETQGQPAMAGGFDSQGHGHWYKDLKRYDIKSRGFYVTASKNFTFMGSLSAHGGLNLSLEDRDTDRDLDIFLGIQKSIGDMIDASIEYDAAINDNASKANMTFITGKRGYLNGGVSVHFTDELTLKFTAYDMLENGPDTVGMDRSAMIIYNMTF